MAVFDPGVQPGRDDMPNWQKAVGSPISDLVADKSKGIAMSGLGNAIEGGTEIADRAVKSSIDEDVRTSTEKIRSDFTNQLEQTKDIMGGGPRTTTMSVNQPDSVPAAIDNGLGKVDSLQSALINGKINDTYYHQRLTTAVTDLRSRYPGYTDYIDQKVSQVTGVNPANAYVNDLMQDINRMQSNRKTAVDTATDLAMKSGYPESDQWVRKLQQDGDAAVPAFRQWYSEQTMFDSRIKRQDAIRQSNRGTKEDIATQRSEDFTNEVGANVSNKLSTLINVTGLDHPMKIADILQDAANNPGKYTEVQMKELAMRLNAQRTNLEQQLMTRANQTYKDAQGRTYSYASDITSNKVSEIIKNQLGVYDAMTKALTDGGPAGFGIAFYHAQHANGLLADTKDRIYSSDVGQDLQNFKIINDDMGPNWTSLVTDSMLRTNVDQKMRSIMESRMTKARAQPEVKTGSNAYTFKDMAGEALNLEKNGQITSTMRARYMNNFVGLIDDITDKEAPDQAKINSLKFFFSPNGQGMLDNFKNDFYDPAQHRSVPGKQTVWNKMTSDEVVSQVAKLSKTDPSIGQMYHNWVETEAGAQLYYKDLQNLNQFSGHDNLHFKYNDGSKGGVPNIELIDNEGALASPVGQTVTPGVPRVNNRPPDNYIFQVQATVNRINDALRGMARVEKGFGGDASEGILRFMNHAQADLGTNWTGLPEKLKEAIAASRGNAKLKQLYENQGK